MIKDTLSNRLCKFLLRTGIGLMLLGLSGR